MLTLGEKKAGSDISNFFEGEKNFYLKFFFKTKLGGGKDSNSKNCDSTFGAFIFISSIFGNALRRFSSCAIKSWSNIEELVRVYFLA